MKGIKITISIVLILLFLSCTSDEKIESDSNDIRISTFYFISHAEKDNTNPKNKDPELSQKGLGRAMHWADILDNTKLDMIYSTNDLKTSMTAAPISIKKNINVQYYNPKTIDIEKFKQDNFNKNILVVGNRNNIPDFVNKIIREKKYPALDDNNNGTLFIVQMINEITTVQQLYFNCSCIE